VSSWKIERCEEDEEKGGAYLTEGGRCVRENLVGDLIM
jgi:hypothetical protein